MEITCAECGCVVERGVIIEPCEKHPSCCCHDLPVRKLDNPQFEAVGFNQGWAASDRSR